MSFMLSCSFVQASDKMKDHDEPPVIVINAFNCIEKALTLSDFANMNNMKTWINPSAYDGADETFKKLYLVNELSKTTSEYNHFEAYKKIKYNNSSKREQGWIYPTITPIELPFLQHVNQRSREKGGGLVTMELGAGLCYVSSKLALAFMDPADKHYANDLDATLLNSDEATGYIKRRFGENHVERIVGDCLTMFNTEQYTHLKGTVDVLYAQTLENYFNPKEHQQFVQLVSDLLAPGGRAYLCARAYTFMKTLKGDDVFFEHYLTRIESDEVDLYPGFIIVKSENHKLSILKPFSDNKRIETKHITLNSGKRNQHKKIVHVATEHLFFKNVYLDTYGAHPDLKVIDAFYCGYRSDSRRSVLNEGAAQDPGHFVAAIVEKVKQEEETGID